MLVPGDATPSDFSFGRGRHTMAIDFERTKWAGHDVQVQASREKYPGFDSAWCPPELRAVGIDEFFDPIIWQFSELRQAVEFFERQ